MDPDKQNLEINARENEIRHKRIGALVGCYSLLGGAFSDFQAGTALNHALVAETIERYLTDRRGFVARNNIQGRIQRHKIAGLMTAAVAKTRPIYLVEAEGKAARVSVDNEFFAVMHGLAICSEGYDADAISAFRSARNFYSWLEDFIYLVKRHPDSADGFTLIYQTVCMSYFGNALETAKEKL